MEQEFVEHQFVLFVHLFPGENNKRDQETHRHLDYTRSKKNDGKQFTQETCPQRVHVLGKMNEVPISSQEPLRRKGASSEDAEQNAAYFEKFKPGQLIHIGPGSEETWNFENMQTIHKECVTKVQHKSRKFSVLRSARSLLTFQKRGVEGRRQFCALHKEFSISEDDGGIDRCS